MECEVQSGRGEEGCSMRGIQVVVPYSKLTVDNVEVHNVEGKTLLCPAMSRSMPPAYLRHFPI
jgi:hypothetical protein